MNTAKILVVEDEFIIAQSIENSLNIMGYTVIGIASSGEKAIEKIKTIKPDLILMDIKLQGEMDGIETACQIRSRFNIPVVFLTAYNDEQLKEQAKMTEPFGYLIKPFKHQALRTAIEIALCKVQKNSELISNKG